MPTLGFFPKPGSDAPLWVNVVYGIVACGMLIGFLWKSVKIVHTGHVGLRKRNGKPRKDKDGQWMLAQPGIHIVLPGTDSIDEESVQIDVIDLPDFRLDVDGTQYIVNVQAYWKVLSDPQSIHDAIMKARNLLEVVSPLLRQGIAKALEEHFGEDRDAISEYAVELCTQDLSEYGAQPVRFAVTATPRSGEQVLGDLLGNHKCYDESTVSQSSPAGLTAAITVVK